MGIPTQKVFEIWHHGNLSPESTGTPTQTGPGFGQKESGESDIDSIGIRSISTPIVQLSARTDTVPICAHVCQPLCFLSQINLFLNRPKRLNSHVRKFQGIPNTSNQIPYIYRILCSFTQLSKLRVFVILS